MSAILNLLSGGTYTSAPVNTVAPSVTGTATVGQTLSCSTGTWTGSPAPTFTYQWQRVTTNITSATSSTYVLVAADAGNTIRCVVTATNTIGAVSANSNSTATIPLVIGQAYGGGFYGGQISTSANGVATHNLVVGPLSTAQAPTKIAWATAYGTTGTTSTINGPGNSATLNSASYPAAQFCEDLNIGGYTDWYLPAYHELGVLFFNLKAYSYAGNDTSTGANPYSVPTRGSNYTADSPALTTSSAFKSAYNGGSATEVFNADSYQTSTEASSSARWIVSMFNGTEQYSDKTETTGGPFTRAIRRVAV